MERREFLRLAGSCAAHLGLLSATQGPLAFQRPSGAADILAEEPWARIERVADGVWAVISTPLSGGAEARRTFSNGGIVAGRLGVAVVEGFGSPAGAQWVAEQARTLTGRDVTHVVLTHHHGDHSAGLPGYRASSSEKTYVTTAITVDRLRTGNQASAEALAAAELVAPGVPTSIDLGNRQIVITPRSGHTASDLTVTVEEPRVLFGGDLLWNHHVPNYVDAIPSVLSREVRTIAKEAGVVRVPGHGAIFSNDDLTLYVGVLDAIEDAARKARAAGTPAEEAAKAFKLSPSLGEWVMFNAGYFATALRAWERELAATPAD